MGVAKDGRAADPAIPARSPDLERVARLSEWLDTKFRVPGTRWRFGLDGLLGLVPGIGDTATALISLYIVAVGWRLGVRKRTLAIMIANVVADLGLGAVPVAGDFFDFLWKANQRNLRLIERDFAARAAREPRRVGPLDRQLIR